MNISQHQGLIIKLQGIDYGMYLAYRVFFDSRGTQFIHICSEQGLDNYFISIFTCMESTCSYNICKLILYILFGDQLI